MRLLLNNRDVQYWRYCYVRAFKNKLRKMINI